MKDKRTPIAGQRIGLVHWAFPPTTGGVESHLADLAAQLSENGNVVTVITGEASPEIRPGYEIVSTPALNLRWIRHRRTKSAFLLAEARSELVRLIKNLGLDVVHGHNLHHFTPEPALVFAELRKELGFRLHHTFHETWPDVLQTDPVYREWDDNYAVSRFVQEQCNERLGFCPLLFPLGIDVSKFRPLTDPFASATTPTILHPARLLPWKGVHVSVQMIALLRKRGFAAKLVLTDTQRIVDWSSELVAYRKEICKLICDLKVEESVHFVSAAYDEMPQLYNRCDIVVYPTVDDEPYGLVPLEAMACGRPILASRSGGIPETVVHGLTGYIADRGDVNALATYAAKLLANPFHARRMGRAGRRHVERKFTIRRYSEILQQRYSTH